MIIRVVDDVMIEVSAVTGLVLTRYDDPEVVQLRVILHGGAEVEINGSTVIMENAMARLSDDALR